MALASFATFVLTDPENHILDAQTAFVSLALFNIMRSPLLMLPIAIVSLIQGRVSVERISRYLSEKELDIQSICRDKTSSYQVSLRRCSFSWDQEDEPILKSISLDVAEGSLVAVVGPVGSGKSSFVSALLGEMKKLEGDINVKGKVAYVPQQPWMQNATLKHNVLFGKPFKPKVFDKVRVVHYYTKLHFCTSMYVLVVCKSTKYVTSTTIYLLY